MMRYFLICYYQNSYGDSGTHFYNMLYESSKYPSKSELIEAMRQEQKSFFGKPNERSLGVVNIQELSERDYKDFTL